MKNVFAFLTILVVGLGFTFAKVPEGSSKLKVNYCVDFSEAFGFSTFPDMPEINDFNAKYELKDTLEDDFFLKNNISIKLMLSCKANETIEILPYIGLDFIEIIPAFNLGVDFEIKKHNFGVGMLIGASEWESKFNNKRPWDIDGYELDKITFESLCLRFLVNYSYFIYKGFYIGTNIGFEVLSNIQYKMYLKNTAKDKYYYNPEAFDGTEFVFQIKVGYRFNK